MRGHHWLDAHPREAGPTLYTAPQRSAMASTRVVGVIGTGGVGKTTVSFLLALATSYGARRDFSKIAAADADVTEAMLTKMLLGRWSGPDLVDLLLERADLDSVLVSPRVSLSTRGQRVSLPGLEPLRVIPGAHSRVTEVRSLGAARLRESLERTRMALEEAGIELVLVDFPPGDPSLAEFAYALAEWIDAGVAVVTPSRRRVVATASICRALEDRGAPTVAVILNRLRESEPFDENGMRWEDLVDTYFGRRPIVLRDDPELARLMVHDSIPLDRLPRLRPVRTLGEHLDEILDEVRTLHRSEGRPIVVETSVASVASIESELREIFSSESHPESPLAGPDSSPSEPRVPGGMLQDSRREHPSPGVSVSGNGSEELGLRSRVQRGLRRLMGGSFEVRYPDGRVRRVKRSVIRSALEMAGLDRAALESYMRAGSVDLAELGGTELDAWRFALLASGLEPVDGW